MNDTEFEELRDSVQRLENKIDQVLVQTKKRPVILWKEFIVGFVAVSIVWIVFIVILELMHSHF